MKNKFTMELVWHNCKTYPPKEEFNSSLIVTNGDSVLGMVWFSNKYHASGYGFIQDLENWWWADIKQTVRGESRFKELI